MSDNTPPMTDAQQYSAVDLDSWWSDAPMTDRQLDVLQGEIDNELIPEDAHFHKQVVRKLLADVKRLRKANKDLAKLSMRTMERAVAAEEKLADIGETKVEWGVQWIDHEGEPYGLHWPGKDEAVQTYTNNHVNGNGDAQLLHRIVGEPRVADVEIVNGVESGLNCYCPHEYTADGKLVRDGVVAAGRPTHDVEPACPWCNRTSPSSSDCVCPSHCGIHACASGGQERPDA